jgi:hypothetical protein
MEDTNVDDDDGIYRTNTRLFAGTGILIANSFTVVLLSITVDCVWMFQGGIFVYDHKLQMFDVALHWLSIPDIIWETKQVRLKNTDIFESLPGPFRICSAIK